MNAETKTLRPANEVARVNPSRIPNESAEYRAARTALLAEEIELRRHIERVAAQRRALPPGAAVIGDYRFRGRGRPGRFRRAVRRQADARDLQLHVRTTTRAPLSDVHQSFGRLGGQRRRHRAEDLARRRRALSDRAPDRVEAESAAGGAFAFSAIVNGAYSRDFRAIAADGTDEPGVERLHPSRRNDPPFLVG